MQVDVHDMTGAVVGQAKLDDTVWAIEPNVAVMHQALVRQHANARKGTHDTRTRGEVSGGGKKPWRQKGTGRARQGSIRSPQWSGGGIVWGPHPRSYAQAMPRKMRRLAIRSALSAKVRDGRLTVIEGLAAIEPRTKAMKRVLEALPPARSVLIVVPERVETITRAANNLPEVATIQAPYLNVRDVLKHDRLVVTREAITTIEDLWAVAADREISQFKAARLAARASSGVPVTGMSAVEA